MERLFLPTGQFTPLGWKLIALLILALLLPLLTYPLGPDNGLFFVAGQKIVHQGAIPYRDIVDVKPPLIYYMNGLAITLFGDQPVSIRIFDVLIQLATCFFLVRLVRRATGSDAWAAAAALLYPLLYISPNFANTSQVESFVGILILPALYLFLFRRTGRSFLLIGLLCGVLTFFKFTFGIVVAAFLLGDLLLHDDPWNKRLRNYLLMAAGYSIVVGAFILYLVLFDALDGFLNMQTFLSGYTGLQWSSKGALLRDAIKNVPTMMADEYSLTMLFGTIVGIAGGIAGVVRRPAGENSAAGSEPGTAASADASRLLRISTIFFLLLLATIAMEAKWLHYHIIRLFPFGAILGGYGLLRIARLFTGKAVGRFRWIAIPLGLILIFAFSPFTRYVFHLRPAVLMLARGADAFDQYYAYARMDDDWTMEELKEIGELVKSKRKEGDKIFISSGVGGMLYLQCDYVPDFHIFHSGFLIAPFAPQEWRDTTRDYLLSEQPRFVIIQQSDRMINITGTENTSVDVIGEMPEVEMMLRDNYNEIMKTLAFAVYEKR